MIKKLLILLIISLITGNLYAQRGNRGQGQTAAAPPVLFREVSGVVRDTTDNTLIGATITLISRKDTLRTTANNDGVFVFKNVKLATFTLTISEVGFVTSIRKYLQNDAVKKLVLEPIVLKSENHMIGEVKINGTPSIVYKIDTIEYKASDYKVRDNATLDELLKKMEGFEVGSDGSVTHQGQPITKLKLNGKIYGTGDVATAIQNLPADIIEKAQVVDDYGDAAARTGIKDGDPQKILNVTTRADRSVGTTGRVVSRYGNDDRYDESLFVQRINANQQIGFIGNLRNTVNGVASTGVSSGSVSPGGSGGSGGTTKSGSPNFNYRDQWGKKIQVIAGYSYSFRNVNSINISNGTNYGFFGNEDFMRNGVSQNDSKSHTVNFQMEITPDSADFIQLTPTLTYSYSNSSNSSASQYNDFYFSDTSHTKPNYKFYNKLGSSGSDNTSPNYGMTVFYQHLFKKPHRNVSLQMSVNTANNEANSESNNNTFYYSTQQRTLLIDSLLLPYRVGRTSDTKTYRASTTYVEPFSLQTQLEFNAQIRKSTYDNEALTDSVLASGGYVPLTARSNVYNYSFTESRITVNYRFNGVKYNISLGATLVPYTLTGEKLNNVSGQTIASSRSDFRTIPVFRFSYAWSRTERFSLNYSGSNTEPSFQEIQPFTDISNPQNIIVGNPDLKPTFTNSFNTQYSNYIANSKLNLFIAANVSIPQNQVGTNIIQKYDANFAKDSTYINETHYVNLNGSYSVMGNYNISKQLNDRKYNLSLLGNVGYSYTVSMNNNRLYNSTNWIFVERLGPRINPTESIEVNPYVGYTLNRSFFTQPNATGSQVSKISLAVDGKMYFFTTYLISYSASKDYINGLPGLSTNPLVINAGFEKEFLKKKNLVFTFNIYDLLHQNNFVQQSYTANSVTNTQSNALSRYFLFGVRLNLQKWSGAPQRNGKKMNRRGDGSFIYE
jgi:hypothetical protein